MTWVVPISKLTTFQGQGPPVLASNHNNNHTVHGLTQHLIVFPVGFLSQEAGFLQLVLKGVHALLIGEGAVLEHLAHAAKKLRLDNNTSARGAASVSRTCWMGRRRKKADRKEHLKRPFALEVFLPPRISYRPPLQCALPGLTGPPGYWRGRLPCWPDFPSICVLWEVGRLNIKGNYI